MVSLEDFGKQVEELIECIERTKDKEFLRTTRKYGDRLYEASVDRLSGLLVMEKGGATWRCMKCGGVNLHKEGCPD